MSGTFNESDRAPFVRLLTGPEFPEKEFVFSGFSFGDVYRMAGWLRTYFERTGNGERPVCLAAADRGIIAASLLASLTGGPALLLPYAFSEQVLGNIQKFSGYQVAITDVPRAFPAGTKAICPETGGKSVVALPTNVSLDAELLRIFSGGTTDEPQVWSKTAANLFLEAFFLAESLNVDDRDGVVATVSPFHIYGLLYSILMPLVASATVWPGTPSFPGEILDALNEQQSSMLISIPAHYAALNGKRVSSKSLRLAISSAGMLDKEDSDNFSAINQVGVIEIYGSTETGGIASRNRFNGEEHFTSFPAASWKCDNLRLSVRSSYISPTVERDEQGFFLCGDQVTQLTEHTFSLQGRVDNITKVGGNRVNLEEIRHAIRQLQGVVDSVVLSVPEPGGRAQHIVALVQGSSDQETIKKALAGRLEPYALPRRIRIVSQIPLTKNGKYDRQAIQELLTDD